MKAQSKLVALALPMLLSFAACPKKGQVQGGPLDGPTDPGGGSGSLTIVNPTEDTWDLQVDGNPKGSIGPRSDTKLQVLKAGQHTVVARNDALDLEQRASVDIAHNVASSHTLEALTTRLEVTNPHDVAIEIVIDGTVVGRAAAGGNTPFDAVPAGTRTLVARASTGPGAVRTTYRLNPGGETAWLIPKLADQPSEYPQIPKPPDGMGLVHMKNDSRFPVYVYAGGIEKGLVAPGAWADIVLPPGTHKLEVKIEGIQARTEHMVTLKANQVAEWIWGSEAPR